MSFTAGSPKGTMSVIRRLDEDGTAQLADLMGAAAMEEVSTCRIWCYCSCCRYFSPMVWATSQGACELV